MNNYYIFLDETKVNTKIKHFCLAGCIIEESTYVNKVVPFINQLKKEVFDSEVVILHEIEIRNASQGSYKVMRKKEKRDYFWSKMNELFFIPELFWTIGVAINCNEYKKLYDSHCQNDEYYVAMQILMENITHFLEMNEGIGTVYVESRNPAEDLKLQNHYHTLKANGTLFFNQNALQKRLGTISFPMKTDNNIGLQLADFIPNPLARFCGGLKQKNPTLFKWIEVKLYNGKVGKPYRFGLKQIP